MITALLVSALSRHPSPNWRSAVTNPAFTALQGLVLMSSTHAGGDALLALIVSWWVSLPVRPVVDLID